MYICLREFVSANERVPQSSGAQRIEVRKATPGPISFTAFTAFTEWPTKLSTPSGLKKWIPKWLACRREANLPPNSPYMFKIWRAIPENFRGLRNADLVNTASWEGRRANYSEHCEKKKSICETVSTFWRSFSICLEPFRPQNLQKVVPSGTSRVIFPPIASWAHFVPQDGQEAPKTNLGGSRGPWRVPGGSPEGSGSSPEEILGSKKARKQREEKHNKEQKKNYIYT